MRRIRAAGPGWTLAAGLLVAIAVVGAVAVAFGGGSSTSTRTVPATTQTTRVVSSTGCSLPAGNQDPTTIALSPPAATWGQVGAMNVPQAPDVYGPQHTTADGWGYCFAHNPAGAVLAAVNLYAEATAHTGADLVRHYAAVAPRRPVAKDTLAGYSLTFAGYRLLRYTPASATVSVVLNVEGRGDVAVTPTMEWMPGVGDWRVLVPAATGPAAQVVDSSLAGYVGWSMP